MVRLADPTHVAPKDATTPDARKRPAPPGGSNGYGSTSGTRCQSLAGGVSHGNPVPAAKGARMDYRKKFVVEPDSKVDLARVDPAFTGKFANEGDAKAEIDSRCERLAKLQYLLYADGTRSLLVVLQGMDAGGKDGTVHHVFREVDPQGVSVHAFKQPTPQELAHDFLWRVHAVTPPRGSIAIFNRSHYEDVLVARVHQLVPKDVWSKRYARIVDFEKNLVQANTHILKFFLHISPEEQLRRFKARLEDPLRQWKISESDYSERDYWEEYVRAYEAALEKTSTERAPWFIIPSDHKWFRNLAVSTIIVDTLEALNMKLPQPHVDLADIARRYHAADAKGSLG